MIASLLSLHALGVVAFLSLVVLMGAYGAWLVREVVLDARAEREWREAMRRD